MSQHTRHARNEAEQRHVREDPLGELDREHGLADVMDGDEQSRLPSHERKSVGSAEIFRPAGAKVHALPRERYSAMLEQPMRYAPRMVTM